MKISNLVTEIFAQAVALDQSGGLRNTIFGIKKDVYIMNYDHTVLLDFKLRDTKAEPAFEHPISFKANDYDSDDFEVVNDRMVFTTKKGDYVKKKVCGTSDLTPVEVRALFNGFMEKGDPDRQEVTLSKDLLELLDPDLSHIEFSGKKGKSIKMIQRNIYSGGIIEVQKANTGLFTEELTGDFGPVAIKTGDFQSLFYFQETLKFLFPTEGKEDFIIVHAGDTNKRNFSGIIACCLYDEIIKIKTVIPGEPQQMTRRKK